MNFILRVYTAAEKVESNQILGTSYNIVRKSENPKEFDRAVKELLPDVDASCYAFITYNSGSEIRPLYKGQTSYIMTDNGNTFSNVSER